MTTGAFKDILSIQHYSQKNEITLLKESLHKQIP